jgi:membrane peptidoglycan carboxypeptidase
MSWRDNVRVNGLLAGGLSVTLAFTGCSVAVLINYQESVRLIESGGEDRLVSDPAVTLYPLPYTIHAGQALSMEREMDRLRLAGYRETDRGGRGTFRVATDRLTIHPMWPEFPNVDLFFENGRVARIQGEGRKSPDAVELDPEPLETLEFQEDDWVPVRCLPRPWAAFAGTPLADAVILREDRDFWTQPDLPAYGLLRAVCHLGGAGGASGLISQLSRNSVLRDHSRSTARKWRELGVATALAARISREKLAELYFNKVRLAAIGGREIVGYPAAARALFGVREVADLTPAQAATLAVMTSLPNEYLQALLKMPDQPVEPAAPPSKWRKWIPALLIKKHEKLTGEQRLALLLRLRNELLENMRRFHPDRYPAQAIDAAKREPLELHPSATGVEQWRAGQFIDYLLSGGLPTPAGRVYTTLDTELQQLAAESVRSHLDQLTRRLRLTHPEKLQASLVALSPDTGELLAIVGARDPVRGSLNRATQRPRSAGSAMKIIVFTWAVDHARDHDVNMTTIVDGENDPIEGKWRPKHHCGGPATLYFHMAQSSNCPPVVLASWIGLTRVQQLFQDQLHAKPIKHARMVIGGASGSEVKMIDLAYLYAALANGGILRTPAAIRHVASGAVSLPDPVFGSRRVFSEIAAFLGLQMMTAPLQPYGTANSAWRQMQLASGPHYAKTGTGQVSDAVYVSILGNRRLLLLAWVGMDDNEPLSMARGFQGASAAMPIVTTVLRQLNAARPELFEPRPMQVPASLTPVQVSAQRGCLVESGGFTAYVAPDRVPGACPVELKRASVQKNRHAARMGHGSPSGR